MINYNEDDSVAIQTNYDDGVSPKNYNIIGV